jgi:hypothetical protein
MVRKFSETAMKIFPHGWSGILLLALATTVILGFGFRGIYYHIFLSQSVASLHVHGN